MVALSQANLLSSLGWLIPVQGTVIPKIRLGLDSHIFLYNASHDGVIHVTEVYDIKGENNGITYSRGGCSKRGCVNLPLLYHEESP